MHRFPGVLEATVFVVTDERARDQLLDFVPTLTVVYLPFRRSTTGVKYEYGMVGYYELMLFRTRFLLDVLLHNISFFLIEADSYWARNVLKEIQDTYKGIEFDMLLGSDRLSNRVQGGFQHQRATNRTKAAWTLLWIRLDKRISDAHKKHGIGSTESIGDEGNEQKLMSELLEKDAGRLNLKVIWLPRSMVSSGLWYRDKWFRQYPELANPSVLLMNFAKGRDKIDRALRFGHFFYDIRRDTCLTMQNGPIGVESHDRK